jgi:ribonuclease HI
VTKLHKTQGKPWQLYIDGASIGNPGPAGVGLVLEDGDGNALAQAGRFIGEATNNEAEYLALIMGLEEAIIFGPPKKGLVVKSDSQLLVKQLAGEYRVKEKKLKPLYQWAKRLTSALENCQLEFIPRGQNQKADKLALMAIDQATW